MAGWPGSHIEKFGCDARSRCTFLGKRERCSVFDVKSNNSIQIAVDVHKLDRGQQTFSLKDQIVKF